MSLKFIAAAVLMVSLAACLANPNERLATGAGAGAATGCAMGAVMGAIVGAGVGAAPGCAVGAAMGAIGGGSVGVVTTPPSYYYAEPSTMQPYYPPYSP